MQLVSNESYNNNSTDLAYTGVIYNAIVSAFHDSIH